jgi:hypothetical protein
MCVWTWNAESLRRDDMLSSPPLSSLDESGTNPSISESSLESVRRE